MASALGLPSKSTQLILLLLTTAPRALRLVSKLTSPHPIVAERLKLNDRLQDNIYTVTGRVFSIFQEQGYTTDDIYHLAPEADEVLHYDTSATVNNVGKAIID